MAAFNRPVHRAPIVTHEGAPAKHITPEAQLRRSVMSCLLGENEFYEDGVAIADRIVEFAHKVPPKTLAAIAIEARHVHHLRHAPLLLIDVLSRTGKGDRLVADTVFEVISRADEMAELLAVLWRNGRKMIPAQMRNGLARAFCKFNEYELAKYDRDNAIKLRDVLRMVRPKPKDAEQAALWKRALDRTLVTPDTWEVALSGGADKKETFDRLLREGKLGYLALLRNLRNMVQAGCDLALVNESIRARRNGAQHVLPFRYIAAARAAPQLEPAIDHALCMAIGMAEPLPGKTIVLVDVSGSMDVNLSAQVRPNSGRCRRGAGVGDLRGSSGLHVLRAGDRVPPRRGMAGVDVILRSQPHGSTQLGDAVRKANMLAHVDRLIVVSDEQTADLVPDPVAKRAYMVNVSSSRNGIGYGGAWVHIDGFSEGIRSFHR